MESSSPLPEEYRPGTLVDLFLDGLSRPRPDAARTRSADGIWTSISVDEIRAKVRAVALGLRGESFMRGDRVAILSHNRIEWTVTDWGIIMSGLVSVPVYPVLPAEQIRYILADSGAKAVFVENRDQLDKVLSIAPTLPDLRLVIAFDPVTSPIEPSPPVLELSTLIHRGNEVSDEVEVTYEHFAQATQPEDLATLIYTSGTTGDPKGVMLTHANFHANTVLATRVFPLTPNDVALAILPLAHVFERTVGHYIMWTAGVTVAYAESTETIGRDMAEVSPTIMAAVPRVFEKVLERAEDAARRGGVVKSRIFDWARKVGELRATHELTGQSLKFALRFQAAIADRIVFSKLRARTGGKIRYFASGGAPLPPAVGLFFFAAKLPIVEGYGLTETSPVLTFNPVDSIRIGTVGRVIPGTDIRIAEDGEILARGPQIMAGYFNKPDATSEAIDSDGWFHTGDIGVMDDDGYLKITDRKKNLIITAYGKNIAPQAVEAEIKRDPLVAEAMMLGDKRKFPIVIVVPDFSVLRVGLDGMENVADAALVGDDRVVDLLKQVVQDRCSPFAYYERPREVLPVAGPFTIAGGELTPTLKVKRRVVTARYAAEIEAMYERAATVTPEHEN
jgi:long-chain acyl-CoA synthetase